MLSEFELLESVTIWTLKVSVIITLTLVTCRLMSHCSAAMRHLIQVIGICGAIIVPVTSFVLPSWQVIPTVWSDHVSIPVLLVQPKQINEIKNMPFQQATNSVEKQEEIPSMASLSAPTFQAKQIKTSIPKLTLPMVLVTCWSSVVLLLAARWFKEGLQLHRLESSSTVNRENRLDQEVKVIARQMKVRKPCVLIGPESISPMVFGFVRSRLIIPANFHDWSSTERRSVLVHELAHLRRKDIWTQFMGEIAKVIHWFNPLIWILVANMRCDQERACDDEVMNDGMLASEYASHLISTASHVTYQGSASLSLAMARQKRMEGRLKSLLNATQNRRSMTRRRAAGLVLIATLLIGPISTIGLAQDVGSKSEQTSFDEKESEFGIAEGRIYLKETDEGVANLTLEFMSSGIPYAKNQSEKIISVKTDDEGRFRLQSQLGHLSLQRLFTPAGIVIPGMKEFSEPQTRWNASLYPQGQKKVQIYQGMSGKMTQSVPAYFDQPVERGTSIPVLIQDELGNPVQDAIAVIEPHAPHSHDEEITVRFRVPHITRPTYQKIHNLSSTKGLAHFTVAKTTEDWKISIVPPNFQQHLIAVGEHLTTVGELFTEKNFDPMNVVQTDRLADGGTRLIDSAGRKAIVDGYQVELNNGLLQLIGILKKQQPSDFITITGRVVGPKNAPLAETPIRINVMSDSRKNLIVHTDMNGQFTLEPIPKRPKGARSKIYRVYVGKDGYTFDALSADYSQVDIDLQAIDQPTLIQLPDITLLPAGMVTITTLFPDGSPAAGTSLMIQHPGSQIRFEKRTNSAGTCEIQFIPEGEFSITAIIRTNGMIRANGVYVGELNEDEVSGKKRSFTITLAKRVE